MWTRAAALSLMAGSASAEAPLSAIDWLSRSVEPADETALPGEVTVSPLLAAPEPIGFVAPGSIGLPATLWSGSDATVLVELLRQIPADLPLPLRDALTTLVTLEAAADDPDRAFLLARIDALLSLGRIDAARRLVLEAGTEDPDFLRRAFDISLLTGEEDEQCRMLHEQPGISATYPARIFCLARLGDWQAAALTLESADALAVLAPEEVAIVARFLHDGEDDMLPPPERPETITPLLFRLYEAIGAPIPTRGLPLAFAHADLRPQNGWKTRIEAAERLYRVGAVSDDSLLSLYLEREPAASGGVWVRAAAVQSWHAAASAVEREEAADAAAEVLALEGLERLVGRELQVAEVPEPQATPEPDLARLIRDGREGEAALRAILRAATAWEGDADDLSRALAALDAVGLGVDGSDDAPQRAASR